MLTETEIYRAELRRWTERYEQEQLAERWRSVVGYEGLYEVSNQGRVRSLARLDARGHQLDGALLKLHPHPLSGHLQTTLTKSGACVVKKVHRLVLEAFVGPSPDGTEGCHWNGNPADNRIGNLRWGTPVSNAADRIRHGRQPGANQLICSRGHRIEGPNLRQIGNRRRCRACSLERARKGPFDKARADRTYIDSMGAVA